MYVSYLFFFDGIIVKFLNFFLRYHFDLRIFEIFNRTSFPWKRAKRYARRIRGEYD